MGPAKRGCVDRVALMRERLATIRSEPGLHPFWPHYAVMPDEPLWAISFCGSDERWSGPWRTATRDLDEAITEARRYVGASADADISVLPTVPRSESYRSADRMLMAMLLAVPLDHPQADAMLEQIQLALVTIAEAKEEGRYFGPLTIDLPIALEVDDLGIGKPRKVRMVTWGDCEDWPDWNRCSLPAEGGIRRSPRSL